jgi:nicotinamidase-related amidase
MTASRLLIVDVQKGFINEWTTHVPARVEALQDSFDKVIISRFYNPQKSLFRKLIGFQEFSLGSPQTGLAFTPKDSVTIIDTPTYSCVNTAFIDRLRRDGVTRVHLCGIATESGVLKCAVDLFEIGIEPVVLAHACGSHCGPDLHATGLRILRHLIGEKQVIGS